jgi:hypothetical protein
MATPMKATAEGGSLFHDCVAEAVAKGVVLVANDVRALVRVVLGERTRRTQDALHTRRAQWGGWVVG